MIKVVKLQHFGSNAKQTTFDLASPTFSPPGANSMSNRLSLANINITNTNQKAYDEQSQSSSKHEKPLKHRNEIQTKQSNEVHKIFINLSEIDSFENNNSKKSTNLNRSKSATEVISKSNNLNDVNKINFQPNHTPDLPQVEKRSILKRQSLKQRKIIEWAKKKSLTIKDEKTINDHFRNQTEDNSRYGGSSRGKKENEDEEEDDFNFLGDAALAIISKSDIERNLRAKLLEGELIDLSKARFRTLEMMDYQKKLFVERQLKKAKSLPGLLRCTALQTAQIQHQKQNPNQQDHQNYGRQEDLNSQLESHINNIYNNQNGNNTNDNQFQLIKNEETVSNNLEGEIKSKDIVESKNEQHLLDERKVKKDKFRDMLASVELNEMSVISPSPNLIVRKSSQFSKLPTNNIIQGQGIKKSNTVHISTNNSFFQNKYSNNTSSKDNGLKNTHDATTLDAASGFYTQPKSPLSRNSNYAYPNENDSLAVRGFRNKNPHVSFYLHQNSDQNPLFSKGLAMNNEAKQNSSNNSVSSHAISRSSHSTAKKVVSLHLQFASSSNNGNLPLMANDKLKNNPNREDIANEQSRYPNKMHDSFGLTVLSANPNKLATSVNASNQMSFNSNSKALHDQAEQSVQNNNNEYSFSPVSSSKYPIYDNRFQDLLKIVKPTYFKNREAKDVNNIIEKNDALKAAHHVDSETKEKMNKIKEKGYKLAMRAKKIIENGEY